MMSSEPIDPPGLDSIAALRIDPEAEASNSSPPLVSARQESRFFESGEAEHKLAQYRLNLGMLGKFFGANSEAPTNIAGFIAGASMLIVVGTLFLPPSAEISDMRKSLYALMSSSLAFIFGASTKK